MTCGACGATIADKAIVCYRCGAPTAVPSPAVNTTRRAPAAGALPFAIVAVLLALVAGLVFTTAPAGATGAPVRIMAAIAAIPALAALVMAVLRARGAGK